jgi:hypothetical protein
MIVALIVVAVLGIAAIIVLTSNGRPSLIRTLLGIPFLLVGLSFPFLFEGGCDEPGMKNAVVTRAASGTLIAHDAAIVWCPKKCVNVPEEIETWLTLPSGITFKVQFTVKDPAALVRALKLDEADRVVENDEVVDAAERALRPYLNGYLETHEEQLLRRRLHQNTALRETHREIVRYLENPTIPGDGRPVSPSAVPYASLGLQLLDLCCVQMGWSGRS